jgi:ferredoxin
VAEIPVGFQVRLTSTGAVYDVPNDKSIVQVLREHDIDVETSCESGLCGTCRTRYVEGEPEHHDYVLDDDERSEFVMICCARSKTPLLVLDR